MIDLDRHDRRLIVEILRRHLPDDARVWAYGSRARGDARRASDLDLLIDARHGLSLDATARLREALEAAPLSFSIDLADMHSLSAAFLSKIREDCVPLEINASSGDIKRAEHMPPSRRAR